MHSHGKINIWRIVHVETGSIMKCCAAINSSMKVLGSVAFVAILVMRCGRPKTEVTIAPLVYKLVPELESNNPGNVQTSAHEVAVNPP